MLKKIIVCLLVLSMNIGIISRSRRFAGCAVNDISGSRYEQAVARLSELGIMKGYDDGTFKPGYPYKSGIYSVDDTFVIS